MDAGTELPYETDDSFSIDWNGTAYSNGCIPNGRCHDESTGE
ncbi:hypothetical protein [Xenorhabdus hominickii]|nr:hypothetical protein [Xenorhabdus hominickii]